MDYIETYVRPKWKSFLLYLLVLIICNIVTTSICFLLGGWLQGDFFTISKDTIFGNVYTWVVNSFAFFTVSPLVSAGLYIAFVPGKYDKEWKMKLIPYNRVANTYMVYPMKVNGCEPIWKENKKFEATLKFDSIAKVGNYSFAVLKDTNKNVYYMFSSRFNKLVKNMTNGIYTGTFMFDTNWRVTNIVEVKNEQC